MSQETLNTIYVWNVGESILYEESPAFTLGNDTMLVLTLERIESVGSHYYSLHLNFWKGNKNMEKSQINVKFSIVNGSGKFFSRRTSFCVEAAKDVYGFDKFISDIEYDNLMDPDINLVHYGANPGNIWVICKIKQFSNILPDTVKGSFHLGGFESFLNNENLSDVTLLVGKKKLRAHKVILSAKSPVFAKMFVHESQENITNEVKVQFDYDNFCTVLQYIYKGKIDNFDTLAIEYFKIADYYQIDCLKSACVMFLKNNLARLNNVIEALKLADDYEISNLKKDCISFFINHCTTGEKQDNLKGLIQSHPHLLHELLISAIAPK